MTPAAAPPRTGPSLAELLPALAATAIFVALIPAEGGFPARVWYPAGLFVLGLAVVVAVAGGRLPVPATRRGVVAVAALAAFTVWSFLSILWADVAGLAWEGANRTLLYLLAFALFAALPLTARAAATVLGVFVVGTAAAGLAALVRGLGDPQDVFLGGRFAVPTDYANANAAVFLIALWPALLLATSRALSAPVRGLLLGAAGVLAELALVCQSRGSVAAAGITALVVLAVAPDRLRLLAAYGLVGSVVALSAPRLLDATNEVVAGSDELASVVRVLLETTLVTGAVLAVAGTLLAQVDRRLTETTGRVRLIVLGAAAVLAATGLAVGVATGHSPRSVLVDARDDVRAELQASRYGSTGSQSRRGDHWRVALDEFRDRPVGGMGSDNFGVAYVRERRDDAEEPLYPHSLPVRVVSQTGVAGTLLFLVFLGAALGAARRARSADRSTAIAVVAAASPFAYWFVHGAADWLWEFPGLSLPALGYLGLAGAVVAGTVAPTTRPHAGRWGRPASVVAALAALLSLGSFAASWLSVREVEAGLASWRTAPEESAAHFARARRLNPLSDTADVAAGVAAGRRGELDTMRLAFERALERNAKSWYSHLELALVDAAQGRRAAALARLETARTLNPKEELLADVARRVRRGERVPIDEIDEIFAARVSSLVR